MMNRSRRASLLLALGVLALNAGLASDAFAASSTPPATAAKAKPKAATGTKVAVLEVTGMT
jgi:hypothetical protein